MGKTEILFNGLKPTNYVEKSRQLLLMKQVPFNLGELRVLDTYLSRINARNVDNSTVSFSKDEYEDLMGIERMRPERLSRYVDSMMGKVVTLPEGDGWRKYVLFTSCRCYWRNDVSQWWIDITCSPEAKKIFFNLKSIGYLRYQLKNILPLKSKDSYLLYMYLRANVFRDKWSVPIDELRETVFRCDKECYQDFKYFRRDILEKSIAEVNEKTDLSFSFFVERNGRKANKIRFELIKDEAPLLVIEESEQDQEVQSYNDDLSFLAQACNNEFSSAEMEVIHYALQQRCYNEDNKNNIKFLYNFLFECYNELEIQSLRQKIHSRFDYLKAIIENY